MSPSGKRARKTKKGKDLQPPQPLHSQPYRELRNAPGELCRSLFAVQTSLHAILASYAMPMVSFHLKEATETLDHALGSYKRLLG